MISVSTRAAGSTGLNSDSRSARPVLFSDMWRPLSFARRAVHLLKMNAIMVGEVDFENPMTDLLVDVRRIVANGLWRQT